jgi:hypothetical protein
MRELGLAERIETLTHALAALQADWSRKKPKSCS